MSSKSRLKGTNGLKPKKKHVSIKKNSNINNQFRVLKGKEKEDTNKRTNATIRRLNMYKQRVKRNKRGEFISGQYMSKKVDERVKRVRPDRRWFDNTRTVEQKQLADFREEMKDKVHDPYTVLLKSKKLPMGLLRDVYKHAKMDVLETESFGNTFGKTARRKRPRLTMQQASVHAEHEDNVAPAANAEYMTSSISSMASLMAHAQTGEEKYVETQDDDREYTPKFTFKPYTNDRSNFAKGQSQRIWAELWKVVDSSDVLIQVLDARDPMGTRCRRVERELKGKERRHKHMILLLNKCDLVPTWVTKRWVKVLSQEYPTIAFHASLSNPFGKGALIHLLRQFAMLHREKPQISVGFVGYPNAGKSAVINTLRGKRVCPSAPVPGETKVWRYVTLFRRVFLIDCPGVVYQSDGNTETDSVLKGAIRVESLPEPQLYIPALLERVKPQYIKDLYGVEEFEDAEDLLKKLARKTGKLKKGNQVNTHPAAAKILYDFTRGRLAHFEPPPFEDGMPTASNSNEERIVESVEQDLDSIAVKMKFKLSDRQNPAEAKTSSKKKKKKDATKFVDYDKMYANIEAGDGGVFDATTGKPSTVQKEELAEVNKM